MARMHSRDKGNSGSTKPARKTVPSWTRYKGKEVELLVVKLGKDGKTPSQIGLILRDTYGIPDVKTLAKKKISKILEEKKLLPKLPEDLTELIRKIIGLRKHFEANKQDMSALRGIQLTESKIKRLAKYYKKTRKLPLDWKYDEKSIRLVVD